ncbi:tripartite tricarboxylate transporter TctB family protein [Salinicoccus sp. ID82-1]|uniref:tripartite tricarboxylate transporter TctB family protein n=1 Tax=Salinicoccus sp. ID82-1 TaxID=2820269 RepID=UPI001F3C813C|nr:tripartite tricarboxylate transporter TctB family protein [Salinicoccus sp. ID82-1]MCG1009741.1 tripartite tricarboxylate transporter TctB family protein [Salinicoccus sp. ID82-1]
MESSRKMDIISGAVLLVLAIGLFISTLSFQQMTVAKIGSAFFPQVASIGIGVLSLIMMITAFLKKPVKEDHAAETGADGTLAVSEEQHIADDTSEKEDKKHYGLVGLTLLLLIAYVAVMSLLGFIISTSLYLFIQMVIMATQRDKMKYIIFAVLSIASSVLIYWIFKGFFNLMLPAGLLG